MNTTEKGDRLELEIFDFFKSEISEGRLFGNKDLCHIYHKKGYYSKDREKDIIFDISIEIFLPGQKTYSILVIIECKNYSKRVPVDDVEEFFAKIQQISGANIKGIVVSGDSFQDGALKFASSKGIGLARYYDKSRLDWVLTRSPSSIIMSNSNLTEWHDVYNGLHNQDFESRCFDFYGYVNDKYTHSLSFLFWHVIEFNVDSSILIELRRFRPRGKNLVGKINHLSEHEIEGCANYLLNKIGYISGRVSLGDVCCFLQEDSGLLVNFGCNLKKNVLGEMNFKPLEIYIDDRQCVTLSRKRFTLAHEIGHFLLGHSEYMIRELCHKVDVDVEKAVDLGVKEIMKIEWQANVFASFLLLPEESFSSSFKLQVIKNDLSDRGFGLLFLDNQKCNIDTFYKVTEPLVAEYDVSRTAIKIRLKKLGLLKESTMS